MVISLIISLVTCLVIDGKEEDDGEEVSSFCKTRFEIESKDGSISLFKAYLILSFRILKPSAIDFLTESGGVKYEKIKMPPRNRDAVKAAFILLVTSLLCCNFSALKELL